MPTSPPPAEITIEPVTGIPALAERWRALESAADGGFFRGWCFVSQQVARFDDPHLLAVRDGGEDHGLALLNRRHGQLFLNETGDPALDSVFVEHNGVLFRRGAQALLAPSLRALGEAGPVTLSGVDAVHLAASIQAGRVRERRALAAPAIDLAGLNGDYLGSLSANARAQIRRAMRLCEAPPVLAAAPDTETALAWFADMAGLHEASWRRRGKPGAFADKAIVRFHEGLIRAAAPQGQADLLSIRAGATQLGYLYNFSHGGRVYCYQSGFSAFDDARMKPGLVSHALAIEHYRARGARLYDLLAGPARYKATLAPAGGEILYWIELYARRSLRGRVVVATDRAKGWLRGLRLP